MCSKEISRSVEMASTVIKEVNDEITAIKLSSEESLDAIGTISLESQCLSDNVAHVTKDVYNLTTCTKNKSRNKRVGMVRQKTHFSAIPIPTPRVFGRHPLTHRPKWISLTT